jgi:predicted nucleic acid-binding protein
MSVPVIVPDASVLLKWALESKDEDDRERALELKDSWLSGACQDLDPTLWVFEVGNILGIKRSSTAEQLLLAMVDLELEERAPHTYFNAIYRLMGRYKVTFYDASYHALAIHTGGTFLTADVAYVKKTSAAGHVVELKDWHIRRNRPLTRLQ